jgi:hypothetical protein
MISYNSFLKVKVNLNKTHIPTHLPVPQEIKSNLYILQHVEPHTASLPRLKQCKEIIIKTKRVLFLLEQLHIRAPDLSTKIQ